MPLLRRSKYNKISKVEIAKSIEDDQRDYSDLDEFEKQERTLDQHFFWFFKNFQSNSKELIWHMKLLNFMHGLKSATLSNFSERAGMAMPC